MSATDESLVADESDSKWKKSACILCECNCGIEVELGGEEGRSLVRVRGDDAHPASKGYACEKPSRMDFYQNGPHRLKKPLRRRADGSFQEIDWDTALREIAGKVGQLVAQHGGESMLYYGGGGQGNHLPSLYSRATRTALGMRYQSSALAQEKTGAIYVLGNMVGGIARADFEHCEVALMLGKNPWHSHGIAQARVTMREIARDPARTLIVIDPRRSETADIADIHMAVRPGCDAYLLAAMLGSLVQENLIAHDWLAAHAQGLDQVLPLLKSFDVTNLASKTGIEESVIRDVARRIARAKSVASFEDLGVQMNRHSTVVSYLHALLVLLTGNFGKSGTMYRPTALVPITGHVQNYQGLKRSPVTQAPIIGGLIPCNSIPDEILSDHPKRFRGMWVETANPAHSLADGPSMREAMQKLDLMVVVDVALTETARLAHYVLPVASQLEKAEATFFNFEFPSNVFHLRRALMPAQDGLFSEAELHARLLELSGALPAAPVKALRSAWQAGRAEFRACFAQLMAQTPQLMGIAQVLLYRAIGDLLPEGAAEGAGLWAMCQAFAKQNKASVLSAGVGDASLSSAELGDALFDKILASKSGAVISHDDWATCFDRVTTPSKKIELAMPEFFDEIRQMVVEAAPTLTPDFPFVLSAGERRSYTANTIIRNPDWRRKDRECALSIHPEDGSRLGLSQGDLARVTTERGSIDVPIALTDRMQPGHISLPNGRGTNFPSSAPQADDDQSLNDVTSLGSRDPFAGTPWHKFVPARVERVST